MRVARRGVEPAQHAVECRWQVDGGGTSRADRRRGGVDAVCELRARLPDVTVEADDNAHGARDADRGCAAHGERSDGVYYIIEGLQIAFDVVLREQPLIDDPHGPSVV